MKTELQHLIYESINALGLQWVAGFDGASFESSQIILERPADMAHGDYASNIAMVLSPKLLSKEGEKRSPLVLAIDIVGEIQKRVAEAGASSLISYIEKVEVAGPGFINFHLKRSFFTRTVGEIVQAGDLYATDTTDATEAGKKIAFEFTDPNPFKAFHIGHLMANTVGESLSRLAEVSGAEVKRFCYQGDVGRHVALTMWGLRLMDTSIPHDDASLTDKVGYFGKAYALGATRYKDLEDAFKKENASQEDKDAFASMDKEIREINRKIYAHDDEEVNQIYDKGREWSLEAFEELYAILGTTFDRYFFESQTAPIGKKIVEENTAPKGKAIFEESQGAVIFPGEKYGLHTRVFLTKDGTPLYETKEIGLAQEKYKAYPYDLGITVTANEQDDYFKVLLKATELLFPEIGKKATHVSHGMMRLTSGKMSSRTGDVITGESLIKDMISEALEKMKDRDMPEDDKKKVAEMIAVAGIKFTVLRQATNKNIIFDPATSLSIEGDSGPYIQYSCVRAGSILQKAEKEGIAPSVSTPTVLTASTEAVSTSTNTASTEAEQKLERLLERYKETVARSWKELAPHHIATYAIELAGAFNSFYNSTQIVAKDNADSSYKVALTQATRTILAKALHLLGIRVPEKM